MARSVNLAPFRKFVREVELRILRTTKAYMKRTAARIEKETASLNAGFFTHLVRIGIDVSGPPALGEFTPKWKDLSKAYSLRKQKKYPGAGFFKFKGGLKRSLQQAKGPTLGRPKVTVVEEPTQVKKGAKFRMVLQPAPELRNLSGIKLLEKLNSGTMQRSMKLSAYKGKITRQLVQPYLNWWVKYVITPAVMRRVK